MEKTITMPLSEYEELCKSRMQNRFELHLHDGYGGTILTYYETNNVQEVVTMMKDYVDDFNYDSRHLEQIYKRNLWERIINKRIEKTRR